jgi:hypothetical protein
MIENGIIKIKTVGGVTYGITHDDLRQTFGVSGSNMGAILQVAQVNPWAKYKPTRCGGFHPNNWWQGPDGYCGFSIPQYANIGELIGTNDVWEYLKPRGNSVTPEEWYVRRDCNGYNPAAVIPFNIRLSTSSTTTGINTAGGRLENTAAANIPENNLLLSDIFNLSNYYFGIVVVRGQQAYIKTNAYNMASGSGGDFISLSGLPSQVISAGTIELYAVLVPTAQTTWTDNYEHTVISLNCEEDFGHSEMTIIAPAENVYRIALDGLSIADKKCWQKRGVIVSALSSGNILGEDTQLNNMSKSYTLQSVTWEAVRHSDSVVVRTGSVSVSQASPDNLPARMESPGNATAFSAPYNVGTLPTLSDATDHYVITYHFNYA